MSRAIAINCTAMLASIIMLASIMLPVAPLDGAYVRRSEPRRSSPSCSLRSLLSSCCAGSDLIIKIATRFR